MGIHCTEEITFDPDTGRKKSRRKTPAGKVHAGEDEHEDGEEDHHEGHEEIKEGGLAKKIRDKY
jgi:hypothetical protein